MSDVPATTQDNELVLTEQDAIFVLEKNSGRSAIDAVVIAYKDTDEKVRRAAELRESEDRKERETGKLMLRRIAHMLVRRHKIQVLNEKLVERMHQMGDTALDTLEELMIEGNSEKVRADVAIEVARHNLGNPDKDQTRDVATVVVVIGEPPVDQRNMADVHRNKQAMQEDIDYNQAKTNADERRRQQREAAIEAEVVDG